MRRAAPGAQTVKRVLQIHAVDCSPGRPRRGPGLPDQRGDVGRREPRRLLGERRQVEVGQVAPRMMAQHAHDLNHADAAAMRIGTCGFARTGMQVQVQDPQDRECAPHETGEIAVIGPAVFAGNFDNAEATTKTFRDGWFLTRDVGHMDEEGFVYLTGRASDMYISGGSNIHPRGIEKKLLEHPEISEVAVFGVPAPVRGEIGLAVVVPASGCSLEPQALPRSDYGKITKTLVREALAVWGEIEA